MKISKKEKEDVCILSASQKKKLDRRLLLHEKGQSKSYTMKQAKKKLLKKNKA